MLISPQPPNLHCIIATFFVLWLKKIPLSHFIPYNEIIVQQTKKSLKKYKNMKTESDNRIPSVTGMAMD